MSSRNFDDQLSRDNRLQSRLNKIIDLDLLNQEEFKGLDIATVAFYLSDNYWPFVFNKIGELSLERRKSLGYEEAYETLFMLRVITMLADDPRFGKASEQ